MARQVLQSTVYATAEHIGHTLPRECPWHPSHDSVAPDEVFMTVAGRNRFTCTVCHKAFRTEDYLGLHLLRRHNDTLLASRVRGHFNAREGCMHRKLISALLTCVAAPVQPLEADVCFADYCDILRCYADAERGAPDEDAAKAQLALNEALCRRDGAVVRRTICRVPRRRRGTAGGSGTLTRHGASSGSARILQRTLGKCFPQDADAAVAAANGTHTRRTRT